MIIQLCDREIKILDTLKPQAIRVYIKLKELRGVYSKQEQFYRSIRLLAQDCTMNTKTITKSLKELKKSGLIDISRRCKLKTTKIFLNYY